jgi:hypothetical protein
MNERLQHVADFKEKFFSGDENLWRLGLRQTKRAAAFARPGDFG